MVVMVTRWRALILVLATAVALTGLVSPAHAAGRVHVSIGVSAYHVSTSGSVRFTSVVRNAPEGTRLVLEQKVGGWRQGTSWAAPAHARAYSAGVTYRYSRAGEARYRMAVILGGRMIAHSRVVVIHVSAPKPPPVHHAPPPVHHACTTTSTGSCIRGGEFCPQASYGMTGWDAAGRSWVCTGDRTHPHWE
jgi:hypothetical protein